MREYNEATQENDVIEEVSLGEFVSPLHSFYMTHGPMIRESSIYTKIISVLDTLASSGNDLSLNNCIHIEFGCSGGQFQKRL